MILENLPEQSSSNAANEQSNKTLKQAQVNLAKALWLVRRVPAEPRREEEWEEAGDWRMENARAIASLRLGLLIQIRHLIWTTTRAALFSDMIKYGSELTGVDDSLWILYPSLSIDIGYLITGQHSPPPDSGSFGLLEIFPLGDTDATFHYATVHTDIVLLVRNVESPRIKYPAILSVVRSRSDHHLSFAIGSQDGLVNFLISSSHDIFPTWKDITWIDTLGAMEVRLRTGFRLQLHFSRKDFDSLKKIYGYFEKTFHTFHTAQKETLVYETTVRETEYHTNSKSKSQAFPRTSIHNCQLRLFEKYTQWSSSTGLHHSHAGHRLAILTPPSFKNISVVSQHWLPGRAIHFGFLRGENQNHTLSLKIEPDEYRTSLILQFTNIADRSEFLSHLTGSFEQPDEKVVAQTKLINFSLTSLELPSSKPMSAFNDSHWQNIRIIDTGATDTDDLALGSWHMVQSESLRVIVDSAKGRFTDRVNIGIGELKIRRNVIASGHELHVLRQPQEDSTFSISDLTIEKDHLQQIEHDLSSLGKHQTIRTYSFPSLTELHNFQSALTGFEVQFDAVVSSFSISRRRMMIPIHKEWASPFTRVQILHRQNVTQLVAFFEGFSHGKCLNFALKKTDIFEKFMRGGKVYLKIRDAKFPFPKGGKTDESVEGGFVCLDLLEYPGEHDNICIGFDGEMGKF